ncbi:MAG: SMP-30/gluconolactonase/LRE family protein [Aestuariibacter sp.]
MFRFGLGDETEANNGFIRILRLQKLFLFFVSTVCGLGASVAAEVNHSSPIKEAESHYSVAQVKRYNQQYCSDATDAQLDLTGVTLARASNIPLMYQGYNNLEGPVWYNGALYYSNMGSQQPDEDGFQLTNQSTIWKWVPGNEPQIWLQDTLAGTNGLALDSAERLVVTRQLDGSISYIDWQSKKIQPLATGFQGKRFNSPNDLTIAFDDMIYFTDPNWNVPSNIDGKMLQGGGEPGSMQPGQRIYKVDSNGTVVATDVTELVPELRDKPNGIALSLDQQHLIVGGLRGLWSFRLHNGKVSAPEKLMATPIDGLGKDCSGNIYVTTTRKSSNRADEQYVVVLDKHYKEIGALVVAGIHIVTNIAFGGVDNKTLFVTGLTVPMDGDKQRRCGQLPCMKAGIYTTRLNVQGFPY